MKGYPSDGFDGKSYDRYLISFILKYLNNNNNRSLLFPIKNLNKINYKKVNIINIFYNNNFKCLIFDINKDIAMINDNNSFKVDIKKVFLIHKYIKSKINILEYYSVNYITKDTNILFDIIKSDFNKWLVYHFKDTPNIYNRLKFDIFASPNKGYNSQTQKSPYYSNKINYIRYFFNNKFNYNSENFYNIYDLDMANNKTEKRPGTFSIFFEENIDRPHIKTGYIYGKYIDNYPYY